MKSNFQAIYEQTMLQANIDSIKPYMQPTDFEKIASVWRKSKDEIVKIYDSSMDIVETFTEPLANAVTAIKQEYKANKSDKRIASLLDFANWLYTAHTQYYTYYREM